MLHFSHALSISAFFHHSDEKQQKTVPPLRDSSSGRETQSCRLIIAEVQHIYTCFRMGGNCETVDGTMVHRANSDNLPLVQTFLQLMPAQVFSRFHATSSQFHGYLSLQQLQRLRHPTGTQLNAAISKHRDSLLVLLQLLQVFLHSKGSHFQAATSKRQDHLDDAFL